MTVSLERIRRVIAALATAASHTAERARPIRRVHAREALVLLQSVADNTIETATAANTEVLHES